MSTRAVARACGLAAAAVDAQLEHDRAKQPPRARATEERGMTEEGREGCQMIGGGEMTEERRKG